jgi:protein O-GlcNAc transferase
MNLPGLAREAFSRYQQGDFKRAEQAARTAVALAPRDPGLLQLLAAILVAQNRAAEAVKLLEKIVKTGSATDETLYNLGTALAATGRYEEAARRFRQASVARPLDPDCHHNLGVALLFTRKYADAEAAFGQALKLRPNWPSALHNWGRAAAAQGKHQEALNAYSRLASSRFSSAEFMLDIAKSLRELKRPVEALASCDRALALKPDFAEAHNNRANALVDLKHPAEALASYDRALALKPGFPEALFGRGNALAALHRAAEALASYDRALALEPNFAEAHVGRGNALVRLEAVASYDRALALKPQLVAAHHGRAHALKDLDRLDEALASFATATALDPTSHISCAGYVNTAAQMCDWSPQARAKADLLRGYGNPTFDPLIALMVGDDPAWQRQVAEAFVQSRIESDIRSVLPSASVQPRKLRLGYLSADFRQHPVGVLICELLALHDRSRFEIYGFSAGVDDQSEVSKRIKSTCDVFVDVQELSDAQLRSAIREAQIDIIIDLGGLTAGGRLVALAGRAAPIQVSYLGYPATVGARFVDYAIVDNFVVPEADSEFFTEKLVRLPHCYLVSDSKRPIAQRSLARSEFGLADAAFVFCCFNSPHKINAPVFDVWMRVLAAVPGSMLWLVQHNEWATENLRKEANLRGVDPARLVFSPRLSYADHLAALRLGDLFLDTWPYNAHTTASDALWVGLPVLTCSGRSFASRVAGSLLHAIGMPELVTHAAGDYEAMAIKLANTPDLLGEQRRRLAANVHTAPLFQTALFTSHIDAAFMQMWERHKRGEAPESFAVEAMR